MRLLDKDLRELQSLAARLDVELPLTDIVRPQLARILPDGTEAEKNRMGTSPTTAV